MPPDVWNFQIIIIIIIIIINNFNFGSVKTVKLVISTAAISYKHTYITSLISLFSFNSCAVDTWQFTDTERHVKLYACPASYVEGRAVSTIDYPDSFILIFVSPYTTLFPTIRSCLLFPACAPTKFPLIILSLTYKLGYSKCR